MDISTPMLTTEEFRIFRDLIYRYAGISLGDHKQPLVNSRLRRRLALYGTNSFSEYYDLVQSLGQESDEFREMINCITTNKTDFFREPHHFKFVANTFVPEIVRLADEGRLPKKLRVWHAGCSTGEEAYTLGMVLAETLGRHRSWNVRQLASDIDTVVLGEAAEAIYDEERVSKIPSGLRRRYLLRGTGAQTGLFKVHPSLIEKVTFRQINLLSDPWPFRTDIKFDLLFCRNVMIYFDKQTQKRLIDRFSRVLRPGGYLFIGHSENMLGLSTRYQSIGSTIYRLPTEAQELAA